MGQFLGAPPGPQRQDGLGQLAGTPLITLLGYAQPKEWNKDYGHIM